MIKFLTYAVFLAIAYAIVGPAIVVVAAGGLMLGACLALAKRTGN